MSTSWFSIGIRFLSGDMARGMRQAGQNFHGMIEGQKRDLDSLGAKLHDLEKLEKDARVGLKESTRLYDERVRAAKGALQANRTAAADMRSEIAKLRAENKAMAPDQVWSDWVSGMRKATQETRLHRAELAKVEARRREMHTQLEAEHQTRMVRLRQLEATAQNTHANEKRRLADLRASAPRGAARYDAAHGSTMKTLLDDRDLAGELIAQGANAKKAIQARLKALGLDDKAQREVQAAIQKATIAERTHARRVAQGAENAELRRAGLGIQDRAFELQDQTAEFRVWKQRAGLRLRSVKALDRKVKRAQALLREDPSDLVRQQLVDQLKEERRAASGRYVAASQRARLLDPGRAAKLGLQVERQDLTAQAIALAERRAGLQPVSRTVADDPQVAATRARIAGEVRAAVQQLNDVTDVVDEAKADKRRIARQIRKMGKPGLTPEAAQSDADIADAVRSVAKANVALKGAQAASSEAIGQQREFRAQADAAAAAVAAPIQAKLADAVGRHEALLTQGEPAKFGAAGQANLSRIAQLQKDLWAGIQKIPGLRAAISLAEGDRGDVDKAEFAQRWAAQERDAARELFNAKRAEYQATKAHVQDLRDTRTQIKQQLWGAIFDLSSKFYALSSVVKRVSNLVSSAAQFQFNARGLSTLLGGERGQGADVYGAYARAARYQTEVSPTAAIARMRELAAAGYSRSEIPGATASIYDTMLASLGEVSESGAFDLGISVHKAFGNSGQDMGTLLDTVVTASNQFPMTIGKIREALGYATEAAVQTGQSLEETLIGIGTIMPITKTASKAGTIFRNAILAQAKPKGQEIMADLGVVAKDERGNNRPVLDVFADMRRAFLAVEKADMAGTWLSPTAAKLEKAKEDKADINAEMFRLRTIEKLKGKLKDPELEQIRLQIAKAYVNKNIEEAKKERAEAISRLNMKKEELEFAFTGQRGGAIFAALERLPELAKASLRGGIYEGAQFKFRDVDDALKAMRLGLIDTAGESRRMSDELRKTSQMLGVSFQVSVEKFKISLGTFLLPVRDAFTNLAMTIINGLTSMMNGGTDQNYGQPGGSPAGSSVGMNLFGSGVMYVTIVAGVKTLVTAFRTLATAKLLFQPKAIEATLAALKGGASLPDAMRSGSLVMANAAGGFASRVGMFASQVGSFLGPFAMVTGGLLAIKVALDASTNAVVDFTHVTEAAAVRRNTKFFGGVRAAFSGIAEGKIYQDLKTGEVVVPEELVKAIRSGDRFSGKVLKGLLSGRDPFEVLDEVKGARLAELEEQYRSAPKEKRDEAIGSFLEEFTRQKDEFFGMTSEDIIRRRRAGLVADGVDPNDPRFINILAMEMNALRNRSGEEYGTRYGLEKGGQVPGVLKQLMDDTHTNSVRDALRVLSYETGGSLSSARLQFALAGKYHEAQNPNGGFWSGVLGLGKQVGAAATGGYLGFVGSPDLAMNERDLNIRRSDFDQQGNFLPGMPGGLVNNMEPVWDKIVKGSDSDLRSEDWLRQTVFALNKLPNALAQEIANAPAFGPNLNPTGSAILGQFFGSPTREVP